MEIQFIKVNPLTRRAVDEEIGKLPHEVPQQLIVSVGPDERGGTPSLESFGQPLRRRDSVTTLTWSLAKDSADLEQTRALARGLDVELTLHAPYYVDFFGSTDSREQSTRQIQWSGVLAQGLGARLAVTHLGFYGPGDRADSIQALTEIATDLSSWLAKYSKGKVRLAIEPSGHPDVFGTREEVLELVRRARGTVPVLNLPHLAARERTSFEEPEDLEPIIREFSRATGGPLYLNFSGVEFYGPGEFRLTPIKRGQVRFDPLAELLSERDYDVTVISSSPLLEHDAMYMKLLYERALTRRWTKLHPAAVPRPAARPAGAVPGPAKGLPTAPAAVRPRPAVAAKATARSRPPARPSRPPSRPKSRPRAKPRHPSRSGGSGGRRH
jgi:deoxyribonuclease IV